MSVSSETLNRLTAPRWITTVGALVRAIREQLPHGGALPQEQWLKRHRVMVVALWVHIPFLFTLGVIRGHGWLHVVLECSILVAAGTVASSKWDKRAIPMLANTLGLLTASALLVHFTEGLIEMHFHYFVIVAAVTLYQAWGPFLCAIAYVVGQHGLMGALDSTSVYNHPAAIANPWKWALIHGFFILGECVTLLVAWKLNENARSAAEASYEQALQEETAKREAQERYGRLFDTAIEGIYETTVDGEIVTANPALARILGYESTEEFISGTTVFDHYVDPVDRRRFLRLLNTNESVTGFEFEAKRRDGEVVWFSDNARAVRDESGRLVGAQGMLEDITARKNSERKQKELEAQLRQAQKMEAFGQLAGGIAHDFNNLLSVIQNYARFAVEGLDTNDQRAQDMHEVLKASDRGADLVRQLLAFSRKDDVDPRVLDLNSIVRDLSKMLHRTIGEHITLETDLQPELWHVEVDAGHIEQILLNLAVNARDAMPEGGTLSIRTANHLGNESSDPTGVGRYAVLIVEDNGCGMTPEVKERVFEPFFTTKDVGSGTGLGLATVYGIVRHWHGRVVVESEPGRGTRFKIFFRPTNEALSSDRVLTPAADLPTGKESILVVEDQAEVLEVVCRILKSSGYRTIAARSAEEAMEVLSSDDEDIDLVLTDVVMTGESGMELRAVLKESRPDLRVILMSGYTGDVVRGSGESTVTLRKPFAADELLTVVRRAIDDHQASLALD
jgi:PAS domain S-box-containing protein